MEALEPLGLSEILKLSYYSSYANRRRHGRTPGGFKYSARGSLRIRLAEHNVDSVWTTLASSEIKASIDACFSLEDEDAEEARLLGQAFAKARGSAEALAIASGRRFGEVRQIRYNRPTDRVSWHVIVGYVLGSDLPTTALAGLTPSLKSPRTYKTLILDGAALELKRMGRYHGPA